MTKNLYRFVAVSRSAFAFPEGIGISYLSDASAEDEPVVRIGASTIWKEVRAGSSVRLPLVLQIDADVWADDIGAVVNVADEIVVGFAETIAVSANAAIGVPTTIAIIDVTPGHNEREFREYAQAPLFQGLVSVRVESVPAIDPVLRALYISRHRDKVGLAMSHYGAALGFFGASALIMAFESLCIATEILADVLVNRELERRSISAKALAKELKLHPPADDKVNWRARLNDSIAVTKIFDSDADLFKTVGKGTNGFEHGTMDVGDIRSIALKTVPTLFKKIRSAFFELADIERELGTPPMSWEPVGLDPVREFIDATLRSSSDSFESVGVLPGQIPSLGVSYEFASIAVVDGHLSVSRTFSLNPRVGEGVTIDETFRYTASSPFNVQSSAKQVRDDSSAGDTALQ
jgi:hypothetical protein